MEMVAINSISKKGFRGISWVTCSVIWLLAMKILGDFYFTETIIKNITNKLIKKLI